MLIEEAIYTMITANAGLAALVEESIYPVVMPQLEKGRTVYPAVVFSLEEREREQTHDGPTKLVKSYYDFSCVGRNYFALKAVANALRLAFNGKSAELAAIYQDEVKAIFLTSESDDYVFDEVEQLSLYHIPMKFTVLHWEALA